MGYAHRCRRCALLCSSGHFPRVSSGWTTERGACSGLGRPGLLFGIDAGNRQGVIYSVIDPPVTSPPPTSCPSCPERLQHLWGERWDWLDGMWEEGGVGLVSSVVACSTAVKLPRVGPCRVFRSSFSTQGRSGQPLPRPLIYLGLVFSSRPMTMTHVVMTTTTRTTTTTTTARGTAQPLSLAPPARPTPGSRLSRTWERFTPRSRSQSKESRREQSKTRWTSARTPSAAPDSTPGGRARATSGVLAAPTPGALQAPIARPLHVVDVRRLGVLPSPSTEMFRTPQPPAIVAPRPRRGRTGSVGREGLGDDVASAMKGDGFSGGGRVSEQAGRKAPVDDAAPRRIGAASALTVASRPDEVPTSAGATRLISPASGANQTMYDGSQSYGMGHRHGPPDGAVRQGSTGPDPATCFHLEQGAGGADDASTERGVASQIDSASGSRDEFYDAVEDLVALPDPFHMNTPSGTSTPRATDALHPRGHKPVHRKHASGRLRESALLDFHPSTLRPRPPSRPPSPVPAAMSRHPDSADLPASTNTTTAAAPPRRPLRSDKRSSWWSSLKRPSTFLSPPARTGDRDTPLRRAPTDTAPASRSSMGPRQRQRSYSDLQPVTRPQRPSRLASFTSMLGSVRRKTHPAPDQARKLTKPHRDGPRPSYTDSTRADTPRRSTPALHDGSPPFPHPPDPFTPPPPPPQLRLRPHPAPQRGRPPARHRPAQHALLRAPHARRPALARRPSPPASASALPLVPPRHSPAPPLLQPRPRGASRARAASGRFARPHRVGGLARAAQRMHAPTRFAWPGRVGGRHGE